MSREIRVPMSMVIQKMMLMFMMMMMTATTMKWRKLVKRRRGNLMMMMRSSMMGIWMKTMNITRNSMTSNWLASPRDNVIILVRSPLEIYLYSFPLDSNWIIQHLQAILLSLSPQSRKRNRKACSILEMLIDFRQNPPIKRFSLIIRNLLNHVSSGDEGCSTLNYLYWQFRHILETLVKQLTSPDRIRRSLRFWRRKYVILEYA